jgi:hypothetical protein
MEKMMGIGEEMERLGVARRRDGPWYLVDAWVADRFLTYLAAALGQLQEVNAAPVTDDAACFRLLAGRADLGSGSESRLSARAAILEELLPVPAIPLDLRSIAAFKRKEGARLVEFRRVVEQKSIEIAATLPEDRDDALQLAVAELKRDRDKIAEKLKGNGADIVYGRICPVLSSGGTLAAGVVGGDPIRTGIGGTGLVGAIYRAVSSTRDFRGAVNGPMAYAAAWKRKTERRRKTARGAER